MSQQSLFLNGGEAGIRTLGALLAHNSLAVSRFRPLSHLTEKSSQKLTYQSKFVKLFKVVPKITLIPEKTNSLLFSNILKLSFKKIVYNHSV